MSVIGATVSHYRVLSSLGSGGMGAVYLAEDLKLKRKVALKFLTNTSEPNAQRRLLREAETASALDHPNIATIFEIGDWNGQPFIAMAYVQGETLFARLRRGTMSLTEISSVAAQVASALAAAHDLDIVHRDLKPANIMLTPSGQVKLLDFGLARQVSANVDTMTRITHEQATVGTLAYMAPEQLNTANVDQRADVWGFGVVLFEMLAGRTPFEAPTPAALVLALASAPLPSLKALRPDTPAALEQIVERMLERDPAQRSITAREIHDHLASQVEQPESASPRRRMSARRVAALTTLAAGLAIVAAWAVVRWNDRRWVTATALPEIRRLADQEQFVRAFALAEQARRYLPEHPELAALSRRVAQRVSVDSTPRGARVSYAAYRADGAWQPVGVTPLRDVVVPRGVLRWRIEKDGWTPFEDATAHLTSIDATLRPAAEAPDGAVHARGSRSLFASLVNGEWQRGDPFGDFWIDRHEITNREYAAFVGAGGYRRAEFWQQPFRDGAGAVSWKAAMERFRDRTGQPGPATWTLGRFPEGLGEYPVTGVSWYEAAAYAVYAKKSLPTLFHWYYVAGYQDLVAEVMPFANFGGRGADPVNRSRALHRFGAFDLAGNVKEWVANESATGQRYILGGAWDEQGYMFAWADGRSEWDRGANFGFRCVRSIGPWPRTLNRSIPRAVRDYSQETPVNDDLFAAYARVYSYNRTPIDARLESTSDRSADWRRETVSFPSAYASERVLVHLFLPKHSTPPYQAVVFLPGAGVFDLRSSADQAEMPEAAFLVKAKRALVLPILRGTYERSSPGFRGDTPRTSAAFRDHVIDWYKDLARTVDFLETRRDIAATKLAYVGLSRGAALAPIMLAMERRFRAAILCIPGFYAERFSPEIDALNFAPRVRTPVLVLNGKYDFVFPEQKLQEPFFTALGTAAADKRRIVYPTGHNLPETEMMKETLEWLDKYLGTVD